MNPGATQLIIILGYLMLLLGLGFYSNRLFRGTRSDYQVASHSIGPFLLVMSLFGTTMTAFALVGSTGQAYRTGIGVYGMLASSSGIIHSLCFFLIGVKVWTYAQKNGYTTQIEFFRDRLDSDLIGLLLFPILVGLVIPYLLIGVISSGGVIQAMTAGLAPHWDWFQSFQADGSINPATHGGVPPWLGSLLICVVVLTYVFYGGMRGTAWANAFQTAVFMVLGVVTFYAIANQLGGKPTFLENVQYLSSVVPESHSTRENLPRGQFLMYLLIPLSVGMFPHVFQHWMTAKSAETFKAPVILQPLFIMIVWVPCILIGVWTFGLFSSPELHPSGPPLPTLPNGGVDVNKILPFLVKTQTGAILGGFLAAGILAAIMSSLDSQFLCLGTIFTNDIVTHYIGKDQLSDRQQVVLTRSFIVAIVALTYLFSLGNVRSVFAMGVWCFSGFAALFPLVVAALYWRGLSALGSIASVLTAIGTWAYLFYQGLQVPVDQGGLSAYMLAFSLGGYDLSLKPVVVMVFASTTVLILGSWITPKPSQEVLQKFFGTHDQ
ncbi:MAG: sodium:solute symporter family protein [Planctomycetota bacterium]|nr:sodium:solute symporter family protein [Planctomycetota bacterium]